MLTRLQRIEGQIEKIKPIFYSFAPDFRRNVRLSYGIHTSGFAEVEMCWQ